MTTLSERLAEQVVEDSIGAPCTCGWRNPIPCECLSHDWQRAECGGRDCRKQFEFRGWHRPTESDREDYVIQSRPWPFRINGRFASRRAGRLIVKDEAHD